jgi:periplasmic divalent cation tolerance protein
MTDFCLILTTAANTTQAEQLAVALLEQRLAACVQLLPITAWYHWQGQITQSFEIAVWIKSRASDFDTIAACISALHSYEVPEIIQLPLTAIAAPYQAWLNETLPESKI